ncbi:hypothetical protein GTS_13030 [Gandjariella thermophila]|uniref:Glycosyl transferase n=1 Tax=Gandjariella thermophila TaxID=1931992 RepID=A0A4D4J3I9_9PSEU|nr:hypothetical protein GTS_13030 [Gandjariella thermophila]
MVCDRTGPPAPHQVGATGRRSGHVAQLAAALARQGHRVVVHVAGEQRERSLADGFEVVGIPVGAVEPGEGAVAGEPPGHLGRFSEGLAGRWRRDPPDVVHAHGWTAGLASVLAAAVAEAPVVQSYHGLAAVPPPRQRAREAAHGSRAAPRARWERMLGRRVAHVLANCSDEVAVLLRMGVPRTRITVVPDGVDLTRFSPHGPAARRPSGHRLVAAAGDPAPAAGLDTVVSALRGLPETELLILGGPPPGRLAEHPEVRRLLGHAGATGVAGRVRLVDPVPAERLPALLRSADAVVCVPWYDPFGTVALEAMACGLPVIAAAVGALADIVVDGVTGLHVPPRRPDLLARTVRGLLADVGMRFAYGVAGRDRVQSRYSWDRIAADAAAVYRRVAGEADRAASAGSVGNLPGRDAYPNHRAGLRRPQLHEVTQLVHQPQSPAVRLVPQRAPPADQRVGDMATVAHLADQGATLAPQQQHAPAAAVPDTVRGQLVHREYQLGRPVAGQPGPLRHPGHGPAHRAEVRAGEGQFLAGRRRLRQRLFQSGQRGRGTGVAVARSVVAVAAHQRVVAAAPVDHLRGQRGHVIGAQQ